MLLEIGDCLGEIAHLHNLEVFAGSAAGIDHCRRDTCRSPFWDNDAMHTGGFCGTEQRPNVLRVLHMVKHKQKGSLLAFIC
jgi:hypothetical protein